MTRQVEGWFYRTGGEHHRGWLPPGASTPLPTRVREVRLTITLSGNGKEGYILQHASTDGTLRGDDWFSTETEALAAALSQFGIKPGDWRDVR